MLFMTPEQKRRKVCVYVRVCERAELCAALEPAGLWYCHQSDILIKLIASCTQPLSVWQDLFKVGFFEDLQQEHM